MNLAMKAFHRLKSITLCSISDKAIHNQYFEAVRSSSNIQILYSAYRDLPSIPYVGQSIFDFASYCDEVIHLLNLFEPEVNQIEDSNLEAMLLGKIADKFAGKRGMRQKKIMHSSSIIQLNLEVQNVR